MHRRGMNTGGILATSAVGTVLVAGGVAVGHNVIKSRKKRKEAAQQQIPL